MTQIKKPKRERLATTLKKGLYLLRATRRSRWILLIFLGLFVGLLEVVGAVLIYGMLGVVADPMTSGDTLLASLLNRIFPEMMGNELLIASLVMIGLFFLLRGATYLAQTYAQNRIAQNSGVLLSIRLLNGYLRMPFTFHLKRNSAELIRNVQGISNELASYVLLPAVQIASESMLVLGLGAVLLSAAPIASLLVALLLVPILGISLRLIQPHLVRMGEQAQVLWTDNLRSLQQSLEGIEEIRVLGKERHFELEYFESRAQLARQHYLRAVLSEAPRVAIETMLILSTLLFMGMTILLSGADSEALAILGLYAYGALRLMPSINKIVVNLNAVRFGQSAITLVHDDLLLIEAESSRDTVSDPSLRLSFTKEIVVRKVSYRYEGQETLALDEVDIKIKKGEVIAFMGPTGGGKTSLLNILLGLLCPTEGAVFVDEIDLHADPRRWYPLIAVVPQQVFLLDDSLRRNIALGIPDDEIVDDALSEALRLAQLNEFVASLPKGLDTRVGERGVLVSGGQRQRIAIARALYSQPEVLFMDEGTSALDRMTEKALIDAINTLRGDRTIVLVTHRLEAAQRADRVIEIVNGKATIKEAV